MQKSGCSLCKSENPLYKNIPSEKNLLLLTPSPIDSIPKFANSSAIPLVPYR